MGNRTSILIKLSLVMSLLISPLISLGYAKAETEYKVVVDGKTTVLQNQPFILNDRMWVPFREIMEAMGATVEYLPRKHLFYAVFGQSRSIGYSLLDEVGLIDGLPFESHFLPIIQNDRAYVPIRNITDMLGLQIKWNTEDSTVSIDTTSLQMFVAVESGDATQVRNLLKSGIDPNSSIRDETALHSAVKIHNLYVAQLLLEHGANVNYGHITPLSYAADDGDIGMSKLLLQYGADPNNSTYDTPLMNAARENYTELVRELLNAGADPNLQKKSHNNLPLFHAVRAGNITMVKDLLQAKADPNKVLSESYESHPYAIVEAAATNNAELIKILLQAGADPNVSDFDDWSPLKVAAELGNPEIIELLIQGGANPNKYEAFKPSALDIALGLGNLETAKKLQSHGAESTGESYFRLTRDYSGSNSSWSSLMSAANEGNTAKVKELLAEGADVNQVAEKSQDTALNLALKKGNAETIQTLLDAGADPNAGNPIYYSWNINPTMLAVLVKHGFIINDFPQKKSPLLNWIVRKNQTNMLLAAFQYGANPNLTFYEGDNPLAIAVEQGNAESIDILLQHGAAVNPPNAKSPIINAISSGNIEMMKKLLALGANSNTTADDKSALEFATSYGDIQAVKILLSHGADPNKKMVNREQTLLQYAVDKGYLEVAELLEAGAVQK